MLKNTSKVFLRELFTTCVFLLFVFYRHRSKYVDFAVLYIVENLVFFVKEACWRIRHSLRGTALLQLRQARI